MDAIYSNPYEVYVPAGVADAELRVGLSAWQRSIPLRDYVEAGYSVLMVNDRESHDITESIKAGEFDDKSAELLIHEDGWGFVVQHTGPVPAGFAARLAAAPDAFPVNRYVQLFPEKDEG